MKKLLITILLSLLCTMTSAAQKLTDTDITFAADPMDLTAQSQARLDRNGVKCALLKVQVLATDVRFQGNVMGDVRREPGEYWVYMTNGTKQVKILSDSFLPYMYYFPEPLQGGVTYILTIDTPQTATTPAVPQKKKQNFLALTVTPPTAHVSIDGTELSLDNGTVSKLLPAGVHTVRITAPGYATVEESVTIADQKVVRDIALRSVKPRLTVTATTPGTEIFINDEKKGQGSWNGELFADSYVIEGRLAWHRSNSQTVTLAESETRTVTIPALSPITGSLSIDYKPINATVTIDGRNAGTTPLLADDLLVGTHSVEISAPGYTTATLTANVTESTPATLTGSLTAKPSDPYAADIALTKEYKPFEDSSTGKYGFKHNGTIVIPARYDAAWYFREGLARVKINGKYGFIDKSGTLVIPARYDDAWPFSEGLAGVEINGKRGFIDKSGTLVIPARYNDARDFSEGLALVKTGGKYGYIDKSGALVILAKYDDAWFFSEGLAAVKINGKYGFIDKSGTLVIPARYDDVLDNNGVNGFKNSKAKVQLNGPLYNITFYIDKNGNEVK